MRGTLRVRLVATVLLLLAVAGALIGLVTALSLHRFLLDRLDQDLRDASRIVREFGPQPGADDRPPPFGPGVGVGVLRAVVTDGRITSADVLDRDTGAKAVPDSADPALIGVEPDTRPRSVDLGGTLGTYRLLASTDPTNSSVVRVTGLPEQRVQDTVTTLVTIEVAVTAASLLGAGVLGAVVIRRELRPLERVAATAGRVSALPLESGEVELAERVPVEGIDPRSEVGQVGAAFNRMLEHVGGALEARHESEQQLRQFVADASHELRTPLAAIRGYAELTRRGELAPDAEHALERISSQAERMTTLVEDLLLLARLDAGRPLERAEVDLTRLVLDAVGDAHVAGPGHRWWLDLPDEPLTVTGDVSRLTQVLTNLLANARTHTPPGTAVTVTLAPEAGGVRLTVTDAGPGIAPELLPHVFERFARGSSGRSRANGSTGLGLAIVDAVVGAHGGSVRATSEPGRTEFVVHLPSAQEAHSIATAAPQRGATG